MIAHYFVLEACHAANYRYYHDWQELTPTERAVLVAHYLQKQQVQSHQQDAEITHSERQQRKKGRR